MKAGIGTVAVLAIALSGCGRSDHQQSPAGSAVSPSAAPTGKTLQADADLNNLSTALGLFQSQTGSLPQQLSDLTKVPGASGWKGPGMPSIPKDPWGHPYVYQHSGSSFKVFSAGPDGQVGTPDDIGG